MKKWIYKNYRRLRKPLFVFIENRRIHKCRSKGRATSDYDNDIPDTRHRHKKDIDKIKAVGIRILLVLKEITGKNKIDYFLFWGTLLGAIRHGGYIPWDDDIDIAMTRSEFKKLENHLYQLPPSIEIICMDFGFYKLMDKYSLVSKDGKRGIGVDIFIIEDHNSLYRFHNVYSYYYNDLSKDQLFPAREIRFEQEQFMIPNKPEEILSIKYGDFMKLPPVEKRVFPHLGKNIKIFDFGKVK